MGWPGSGQALPNFGQPGSEPRALLFSLARAKTFLEHMTEIFLSASSTCSSKLHNFSRPIVSLVLFLREPSVVGEDGSTRESSADYDAHAGMLGGCLAGARRLERGGHAARRPRWHARAAKHRRGGRARRTVAAVTAPRKQKGPTGAPRKRKATDEPNGQAAKRQCTLMDFAA